MTEQLIHSKISLLRSEQLKQELLLFLDFLLSKQFAEKQEPKRIPKFGSAETFNMASDLEKLLENDPSGFGCLKGKIHLAPDWNEPLEDFKEYMY